MQSLIDNDEGVCVCSVGEKVREGVYKLKYFESGKEYFDFEKQIWIKSIVQHNDGTILATNNHDFEGQEEWKRLWSKR